MCATNRPAVRDAAGGQDPAPAPQLPLPFLVLNMVGACGRPAQGPYGGAMTARVLRYSSGNEHNPADPWGRSELTVHGDGRVVLEQHHSRRPGTSAWAGQVDPQALSALWAALDASGFPAPPAAAAVPPDSVIRQLTVEEGGGAQSVMLAGSVPGYAAVVGLLDGLVHRLSDGTVGRPA